MAHAWRKSHRLSKATICLLTACYCAIPALSYGASGQTTLGARIGNKTGEGFVSILAALSAREDSLLFLNPRFSLRDEGETEGNIGLGFRKKLAGHNAILGANLYYDSRRSQHDNRFNQWGAGLEFLSKWIDARINYYDPEDKEEMINAAQLQEVDVDVNTDVSTRSSTRVSTSSTELGTSTVTTGSGPFFTGNNIATGSSAATTTTTATTTTRRTTTTTTRTTTRTTTVTDMFFEQFEAGLEGIDAEIGVMLPLPDTAPEVRLFAGYYDFDGAFDKEIKGAKGRLEVRAGPFVTLDAEVFEDKELNGTDWFLGARFHFPFDTGALLRGENPFKGPKQAIQQFRNRPIEQRLVEDVIRDVRVQTEESEFAENKTLRQVDVEQQVDVQTSSSTQVNSSTVVAENTVVSGGTTILTDASNPITVNHVNDSNVPGDGTFENPHGALDDANTDPNKASRNIVFVHSGTTFNDQSYTAAPNQRVLGEGDNNQHLVNTDQLGVIPVPESSPGANGNPRPVIQNTAGVAFDANNNTEISNFTINSPTGVRMIALNGNVNANRLTVINSTTGIDITGGAGQFTITDVTVTDPTTHGINIDGGTSNIVFGSTVIDPGNGLFGPGDINQNANGSALMVMGGHSGSFMFNNGTINATDGDGLQFNNADGNYGFAGPVTLNGGDAGIDILGNSNGTFTFAGTTSITNPTGDAFNVTGDGTNNPSITYSGNIQNSAGDAVEINNTAGGANSITFQTGTITDSGSGIFLNNVGQNVDFNGTATLTGSEGIDIDGGTGSFTFADTDITNSSGGSGLDIAGGSSQVNFGSASSIAQNQNQAAVNVNVHGAGGGIDFSGTIVATNGMGLQFNNADGTYNFNSDLTLNGGDAGIDILNDSAGTFTFDGTTAITNSAGPAVNIDGGGAGQNAQVTFNALDINQSIGAGVLANNSASLMINFSDIDNTTGDGINVTNTNLSVDFTNIGVNAGIGDDGIQVTNSDTAARAVSITNSNIGVGNATGNRGVFIDSSGTGTLTATLTSNQIESTNQVILTNDGGAASSLVLDLQNSTLTTSAANTFTQEIVGSGLNSTIVRSWTGPNQVIGVPSGSGGILFNQVTFDGTGAALGGTQVMVGGSGVIDIGTAGGRVQGDGLSFLAPTGDLSIPTLNIFNNAGTGLEVDTKSLGTTFNLTTVGGTINTTGGPAMFLDPLTGGLTFSAVTSTNSSNVLGGTGAQASGNGTGITLDEFDGTLTIGTTTVTNPAGDGIVVINDGTGAGLVNFGNTDVTGLGASTGVDLTRANGNITFNTLDITGSGAAGSTGIDLTGTTNAGTAMTNDTSSIQNVQIGVDLTNANMTGMLQFGDGENMNDTASTIDTGGVAGNNAIVITGLNSTNGSYNFLDVDFANPPSANSDTSNLAGPDVYWIDMIGAGTGTKASPGSVTGANASIADVLVLVNSAAAAEVIDASNDVAQGSDDTLILDPDQVLVSFNTSDSVDLAALGVAGGAPANVLLTGIVATSTVDNKFNGFAPTLTTTGANNTVVLGNNSDVVGVNLANGGTGHALSGIGVTGAVTVTDLNVGATTGGDGVNINNSNANFTFDDLTVTNPGGDGLQINGGGGGFIFNGATTVNTTTAHGINVDGSNANVTFVSVDIDNTGGDGIKLVPGTGSVDIQGGSIDGATGNAFSVNGGDATITYSGTIANTAGNAIAVQNTTGGMVTFNSALSDAITDSGTGIFFNNATGNVNVSADAELTGLEGIDIDGSSGTFTFTDTDITNPTGTALDINGGTSNVNFEPLSSIMQTANNQTAVNIAGGHATGTLTFDGNVNATMGDGLQFNNADGNYNFVGPITLNGDDAGIDILGGSAGTFTFGSGTSITDPTGVAYREDNNTASVTYNGTISKTNNAATTIDINGKAGGTTDFNGSITASTMTVNAIDLTGNAGGTINFDGGLDIDTTTGTGFNATGGGTVNVTANGVANTVNVSGAGQAVKIQNTDIGASGVTFRSINQTSGGTNAIVLDNTGSVGGTFFEVTGDGPSDPTNSTTGRVTDGLSGLITIGSGGTITGTTDGVVLIDANDVRLRNMVIGDATATPTEAVNAGIAITDNGIEVTNVTGLTLDNVLISDTGDHGIQGFGINTGLTLRHTEILNAGDNGAGATDGDDGMDFKTGIGGPAGPHRLVGTVLIDTTFLVGMADNGLEVENTGGDLDLTVTNSVIGRNHHSLPGCAPCEGDGFLLRADGGSAMIDMLIQNTVFDNVANDGIDIGNDQSSNITTLIAEGIQGTNNSNADNLIDTANTNGTMRVRVADLISTSAHRGTVLFFKADGSATTDITINTDTMTDNLIQGSTFGNGIEIVVDGNPGVGPNLDGNARILIEDTIVSPVFGSGIFAVVQDHATGSASAGYADFTIRRVTTETPTRTDNVIQGSMEFVAGGGGNGTLQLNLDNTDINNGSLFFGTPTEGLVLRGDRNIDVAANSMVATLTSDDAVISGLLNALGNTVNGSPYATITPFDVFTSSALRGGTGQVLIINPGDVLLPTLP